MPLRGESGVIGRDPEHADTVLGSVLVSRRHAAWRRVEDDSVEIVDLGSANGTFVDGQRLGSDPVIVRAGQQLDFGAAGALVLASLGAIRTTQRSSERRLEFVVESDGSVALELRADGASATQVVGLRAELLFLLARQAERDAATATSERGWMERGAVVRRLYGRDPAGANRFSKLLHDTRELFVQVGLPTDLIETRAGQLRMRMPDGGLGFPRGRLGVSG